MRDIVFAILISIDGVAYSGIIGYAVFLMLTSRWER